MTIRSTHTYVELEVSAAAYDEIAGKLRAAAYDHAFHDEVIDMHGIGLTKAPDKDGPPQDGWWPAEADAPMTQMYFIAGRPIANIIRQPGILQRRWRAFSLVEMNKSGTTGKPLGDSVDTREDARKIAEDYAAQLAPEKAP
jgi:hypothetical protein